MDLQKRFIIVLTLPEQIERELQPLREKYDRKNSNKIIPHVTLRRPFLIKTKLEQIEARLEEIARNTKEFKVMLKGVEIFTNPKRVVYVTVEETAVLRKLYVDITTFLNHSTESFDSINYQFTPHVTLGSDLTQEEFQKVQEELADFHLDYKFTVRSFGLFEFDENNIWQLKMEFKFK